MVPKSEAAHRESRTADCGITDPAAALRRRQAVAIVERYANYSAIGGAIPVPLANAAAITALLVRMVKSLSELYGVPFERNRTRSVVIALMGGALPTGFATIATSTIYFVRARLESSGSRRFVGDLGGLCPQHRPAVHRAFRERRGGRFPLDHQALNARGMRLADATAADRASIRLFAFSLLLPSGRSGSSAACPSNSD